MYLYGASGHAKVIIDILTSQGVNITALADDNLSLTDMLGYKIIHSKKQFDKLIISIGDNLIRKKLAESLDVDEYLTAIAPSAIISPFAKIKEGSVVMQGSIIQSCAQIGAHVIINSGASIDHDCVIGDFSHISPHATLCGNVTIGEGTWIGAGTVIKQGVKIGNWTTIGAGSVVVADIPDGVTAYGNPCKIKHKNISK